MPRDYYPNREESRKSGDRSRRHEEEDQRQHKYHMDSEFMGMISEDHTAPANLPQHVIHKYYPRCAVMDTYEIDDTRRGLDETRDYDIRKMEKYQSDVKY